MNLFEYADAYPDAPGHRGVETSIEAADKTAKTMREIHRRILESLKDSDATPDEMAARINKNILQIRPRFTELHIKGLIERTGEKRKSISGNNQFVYDLVK